MGVGKDITALTAACTSLTCLTHTVAEVCNESTSHFRLSKVNSQLSLSQPNKQILESVQVLLPCVCIHNSIIYIPLTSLETSNGSIDHTVKGCWCFFHAKRHYLVLKESIRCDEGRYLLYPISQGDLPVTF